MIQYKDKLSKCHMKVILRNGAMLWRLSIGSFYIKPGNFAKISFLIRVSNKMSFIFFYTRLFISFNRFPFHFSNTAVHTFYPGECSSEHPSWLHNNV